MNSMSLFVRTLSFLVQSFLMTHSISASQEIYKKIPYEPLPPTALVFSTWGSPYAMGVHVFLKTSSPASQYAESFPAILTVVPQGVSCSVQGIFGGWKNSLSVKKFTFHTLGSVRDIAKDGYSICVYENPIPSPTLVQTLASLPPGEETSTKAHMWLMGMAADLFPGIALALEARQHGHSTTFLIPSSSHRAGGNSFWESVLQPDGAPVFHTDSGALLGFMLKKSLNGPLIRTNQCALQSQDSTPFVPASLVAASLSQLSLELVQGPQKGPVTQAATSLSWAHAPF